MTWPQDWQTNVLFLLRWGHFLAGITWIGLLYFFNLVNVSFMKELDAASKGKVVPHLMPKALWWFRWGAVWTVFFGFLYYLFLLGTEKITGRILVFLVAWTIAWLIVAALLRMSVAGGPLKDGRVLAAAIAILVLLVSWGAVSSMRHGGSNRPGARRHAQMGAPRLPRFTHERLALHPDALLHGRREPFPHLRRDPAVTSRSKSPPSILIR